MTDPTTSSLSVFWEPAEGNVRQYRIFYHAVPGGPEDMVYTHSASSSHMLHIKSQTENPSIHLLKCYNHECHEDMTNYF